MISPQVRFERRLRSLAQASLTGRGSGPGPYYALLRAVYVAGWGARSSGLWPVHPKNVQQLRVLARRQARRAWEEK